MVIQYVLRSLCLSPALEDNPSGSREQYIWHLVGVLDYRKEVGLYMVQRIQHKGKRRDKDGSAGQSKKQSEGISTSWLHLFFLPLTSNTINVM